MSFLTNFNEWSNKLSRVDWINTDGSKKVIGNRAGNEVTLSVDTKLMVDKSMPIQAILRVRINGVHVAQWGSVDNENTLSVVKFFNECKASADRVKYELERDAQENAEAIFDKDF